MALPPDSATTLFAYDLFISYSAQDKAWVRSALLPRLEAAGLRVCIDFRDFQIGAPGLTELERGITTSRKTLLVLTPAYLASNWAEFENLLLQTLDPANRARRLLPLLRERCDLPPRIGMLTPVDFTDPTEAEDAWRRLLAGVGAETPPALSLTTHPDSAPVAKSTPANRSLRQRLTDHVTWRRVGIGTLVTMALALIGLWADILTIGNGWQPGAQPPPALTVVAPTVTTQPTPASFTYSLTVTDKESGQSIANATVRIEVEGKAPLDEYTDSNGFARLFIPAALVERPGRLTVEAEGYGIDVRNIDLWSDRLPAEVRLTQE